MTQSIFVQNGTTLFRVAAIYLWRPDTVVPNCVMVNRITDPFSFGAPTTLILPSAISERS